MLFRINVQFHKNAPFTYFSELERFEALPYKKQNEIMKSARSLFNQLDVVSYVTGEITDGCEYYVEFFKEESASGYRFIPSDSILDLDTRSQLRIIQIIAINLRLDSMSNKLLS